MMLALAVVIAYLLGSLSGSLLAGRVVGVDIRTQGSGSAGGTNAFRTRGWKFALAVVAIDIGKGALAAWLGPRTAAGYDPAGTALACTLVAAAGHTWPVYFGFRGGKGAATLVGGLLVAWPMAVPVLLVAWLLVLTITGYVGLSTVVAAALLLPLAWWQGAHAWFAVLAAGFIVYTHRANLQRLRRGNEHRFERARLWARWFGARTR